MKSASSTIAVDVAIPGFAEPLSYELSDSLGADALGAEVVVEVGHSMRSGWVVGTRSIAEALDRLKAAKQEKKSRRKKTPGEQLGMFGAEEELRLKRVVRAEPAFEAGQLKLFSWMAEYYGVPLADVIDNALPRRAAGREPRFVELAAIIEPEALEQIRRRAKMQVQILDALMESEEPLAIETLQALGNGAPAAIRALEKKGLVRTLSLSELESSVFEDELLRRQNVGEFAAAPDTDSTRALTESQGRALDKISTALSSRKFAPFLLFGVTGSGKTEVYIRAIQQVLERGGSALLVVPEISLTPQLIDQFQSRLSVPIALLHSQVGTASRWQAWQALLEGKLRVAIGARSAIFAPIKNLELVIVDEEHENSYKQSDGFRYNGRDVAVMRAKFADCPVILGSATPSFESLLNVQKGRYQLLEMPERVSTRPLPKLEIVDLNQFRRSQMISENISPALYQALDQTLGRGGQAIIFYNRRGFSSYLQCESCSEVVSCPHCSITLTYHKHTHKLLCHSCGLSTEVPNFCRFCRDPKTTAVELDALGQPLESEKILSQIGKLEHRGGGTERVLEELVELFPGKTIARMDRDSVTQKDSYRRILGDMRAGRTDILIGTQMIAKGHDLPGVTLVGIINADIGLHLPDFRSSEKIFQLITQAAGRAGRGNEPGRVIVQTRAPRHPTIIATAAGRFKAFARYEIDFRKKLNYPPWGRLLRVVISSTDRAEARRGAQQLADFLAARIEERLKQHAAAEGAKIEVNLLGPAPAALEKLRARYRWHLIVKSPSARLLSELALDLYPLRSGTKDFADLRLAIDVDPVDML